MDVLKKNDEKLLSDCLEALEYATYHDGRYGQERSNKFQDKA